MSNKKTIPATDQATNYVLIDYENVQPKNLELLEEHPFKVMVFLGVNQTKLAVPLVQAMQHLGKNGDYIQITGSGQNALDFHIAYYVGRLAVKNPEAHIYIVSRDKGFEPLIRHLKDQKISIRRVKDLVEIPALRISTKTAIDKKIERIVKILVGLGQHRPRKVKPLQNLINNLIAEELLETELASLVEELRKRKLIVVNESSVSYKLTNTGK